MHHLEGLIVAYLKQATTIGALKATNTYFGGFLIVIIV